jgi:hypothetical protein
VAVKTFNVDTMMGLPNAANFSLGITRNSDLNGSQLIGRVRFEVFITATVTV